MDNLIAGVVSAAMFLAFIVGLANSIGEPPFMIIVGLVSVMMLIDLVQSVRKEFARKRSAEDH